MARMPIEVPSHAAQSQNSRGVRSASASCNGVRGGDGVPRGKRPSWWVTPNGIDPIYKLAFGIGPNESRWTPMRSATT